MKTGHKKFGVILAVLLLIITVCMLFANIVQTDRGKVRISREYFDTDLGTLSYKLYVPASATESSPAPAVLLLRLPERLGDMRRIFHRTCKARSCGYVTG